MYTFYRGTIESILSSCITVWFGACNASCHRTLQRIVRAAERIIGVSLPSLQDIYSTRLTKKALCIAADPTHPMQSFFKLLPSGRRLRIKMTFTSNHLEICKGTLLGGHYKVEGFLEEGGFGIVTKCCNTKTNKVVAIKVNKSDPEILQQAKMEIYILEKLRGLDADRCNIVKWNDFFIDGDRICLNFELLDESLWQYMRYRRNRVLPVTEIRPVLFQLANALSHLGSLGIVHADLKPGNIMVVDRYECPIKVKLTDFGFACPASTVIPGDCVGTVGYKAPEVMIGSLFNEAIDMWSLGLVAVELATGYPFYPGRNDYDTERQFQDETGCQSKDTRSIKLKCLDDLEQLLKIRGCWEKIQNVFVSLIKEMLALDPNQRITPSEVLHHPFFNPGLSKSSPCTDMSSTGGQNLVVSQQPSSCKREESQKISCSSQTSEEFSQQEYVNASANTSSSIDDLEISKGTFLGGHYERNQANFTSTHKCPVPPGFCGNSAC
uniref:Protein kinase domain-containing protein n=1 Tax=Astatotilapia calliptera TaxID=8154 RepID=A0A3P8P689_ASTCA